MKSTVVHGVTGSLQLYKAIAVADVPSLMLRGRVTLAESGIDKWQIGLREKVPDALECEIRAQSEWNVSKDTHLVLEITFSPLGIAHCRLTGWAGPLCVSVSNPSAPHIARSYYLHHMPSPPCVSCGLPRLTCGHGCRGSLSLFE